MKDKDKKEECNSHIIEEFYNELNEGLRNGANIPKIRSQIPPFDE